MKRNWIISSILLLAVGAVAFRFYQIQRIERDVRNIRELPMQIGEWKAADLPVSDRDYDILETRNLVLREYRNGKGESIGLFLIYSETNRRVCHPPVVCLIGSGFEVTKSAKETVTISGGALPVNRLTIGQGKNQQLVLYWYMMGKNFTDDYITQQLRWIIQQATGKGVGGAMVRVITPISGSEEEAMERAKGFIEGLLPLLAEGRSG